MTRFEQYDGGKGPEDRSDTNKRANSPLWKQVKLPEGNLSPEDAALAIVEAMTLAINLVSGPDSRESDKSTYLNAAKWLRNYFPKTFKQLDL